MSETHSIWRDERDSARADNADARLHEKQSSVGEACESSHNCYWGHVWLTDEEVAECWERAKAGGFRDVQDWFNTVLHRLAKGREPGEIKCEQSET